MGAGDCDGRAPPTAGRCSRSTTPSRGSLEVPGLAVDGDRFLLEDEECAEETGYAFYDNEYDWELTGSTLTLSTVKNDCPDRVAETILTSQPWTKQP